MSKVTTIANQIWAMANELRGNMGAEEYKNYILGFIFYRYLSEHQAQYLIQNNILEVKEGQSLTQAYQQAVEQDGLEDYLQDMASALGYAINPEHMWDQLVEKIQQNKIAPSDYQAIFDSFNQNTEINIEAAKDFRGVFNDLNLGDSRLGNSINERTKALNKVVLLVNDIQYKDEKGRDILGEIYEELIGKFAANAGKKGGEFYTPHAVSQILAKIVTINIAKDNQVFSVYDPTCGSGSLLLTVSEQLPDGKKQGRIKFYGQELNTTTYNLARMNLMMHGVSFSNMTLSNANTLESDWPDGVDAQGIDRPRTFNAVVANPPYSANWDNNESKLKDPRFNAYGKLAPKSKADFAFVLHGLYHLNNEGTMAVVLPHGVLFRGAAEGHIRQVLIEKNYIDTVIGLPANLFFGAAIPTCILVLKKNKTNKNILFIDASNEFEKGKNQNFLSEQHINKIIQTYQARQNVDKYAYLADFDEIKTNDFNLNIPRYVDTFEEEEEIDLNDVMRQLAQDNQEIAQLEQEIKAQLKLLGVEIE
ncbi:type I restriction-modification system subunit M [Volucribacter amazonae]|uniref:site-specific DNA-methyltransferase (adenine-specific) n=1 Tax=Volucribacter amazonae TaxID=256731 RepID=A0A9X4SHX7_9PAST|nr:type I restriction-modification system subunit M [Volucribacter amazonae]MDG6894990.1 type I restriction endonuclease subunit M [Volucribacter amazonae]